MSDNLTDGTSRQRYSRLAQGLVWTLIVLYILFFASMSIRQHEAFQTSSDLGTYDQPVWNTIHGRLFRFTNMAGLNNSLSQHVELILLPISLSYLIYSSPKTLLVLQTIAIAIGAWPIYLLAREKLRSEFGGTVFAAAYLLSPALEAANLFNFHSTSLTPPLLLWAFHFLEKEKDSWSIVFSVLAMSCKEEISLLILMMGLYALFLRKRRKLGMTMIVAAVIWFYVAVYVIIGGTNPRGKSPYLAYYQDWGDDPFEIAFNIIRQRAWGLFFNKDNFEYLFRLFLPLAFLPLFNLPVFLIALPSLAINLLSNREAMHRLELVHYAAPIVPFTVLAAIYGAEFLTQRLERGIPRKGKSLSYLFSCLVLVCSLGYHHYRGFTPLSVHFQWPVITEHHRLAQKFIDMIPPTAPLSAHSSLDSHLSQREKIYVYPDIQDAEYVFLDISHWVTERTNKDNYQEVMKTRLLELKNFGLLTAEDGYMLLRRGAPKAPLPESFYTFAQVRNPDIQYPLLADFDSHIEFLGFDVIYRRDEEPIYDLYFRARQPLDRDYLIALYLVDEAGQVVGSTVQPQPATVWYPISQWQPGEVIKVRANTLSWWTGDRKQYSVALGIMDGNDTWDVGRRLRPRVIESERLTPLPADGTLLQLMTFRNTWAGAKPMLQERRFTVPEIEHPMEASLEDQVRFLGYDLSPPPYKRGETLHLTLYWQAMTRMDESYTVFVHLLNKDGIMGGQWDSVPGGSLLPTTSWLEGEVIADKYAVPIKAEAPPGEYTIEIGMYLSSTGEQLEVRGEGGNVERNSIVLSKIEIPRGEQ